MSGHCIDSWDYYLDSIKANRMMDADLKGNLLKSIPILRKNLGEGWPSESKDPTHKIRWLLRNAGFKMDVGLLVFWGHCMSVVEESKGFEGILDKIRHSGNFGSPIAELEMAGRLAWNGCHIEFEPNVGGKKPDLFCQYGKTELFFEVKTLITSIKTENANQTELGIHNACNSVHCVGRICKTMSAQRLKKVTDELSKSAEDAISGKKGVAVCNKYVKMYLVPRELPEWIEMCRDWLREKADNGEIPPNSRGLSGPPDSTQPEGRIKARINQIVKERQIPPDKNGVLAITEQSGLENINSVERIVDMIVERVNRLENIPAVVLISPKLFGEVETGVVKKENFVLIMNHLYDEIQENVVIVKNDFFKPEFDYGVLKSMLSYSFAQT